MTDVLVVGGGPAGAAAAYWLARHGHDVTVVERKTFPREKTCGDGLTPRAVHQLGEMGLDRGPARSSTGTTGCARRAWAASSSWSGRRTRSTRSTATSCAGASSTRWSPATRVAAGATLLEGHEAVEAIVERGFVRGAIVQAARRRTRRSEIRARVHRRRRRGEQPLRSRARHVPHTRVAVRHGDPHVLAVAAPRRAVDRVGARREGSQRQPDARLRLDLPRRRRHASTSASAC